MSFDGPDGGDYENVTSLNQAYLTLLWKDRQLCLAPGGAAEPVYKRIRELNQHQVGRLATTPFLLFSFRERDDRYWGRVLGEARVPDLFRSAASRDIDTLVSAALGFIWQLARTNPYALRLICGATLHWCERVAEPTFYQLLDAVRCSGDLPILRLAHHSAMWQKLLDKGTGREKRSRCAAQMSALQTVLTELYSPERRASLSLAARNVRAPGLHVAEENDPRSDG